MESMTVHFMLGVLSMCMAALFFIAALAFDDIESVDLTIFGVLFALVAAVEVFLLS